jgi:hypothetical protein
MKFLLLVCWDAERMDAQAEHDPTEAPTGGELSLARRDRGRASHRADGDDRGQAASGELTIAIDFTAAGRARARVRR